VDSGQWSVVSGQWTVTRAAFVIRHSSFVVWLIGSLGNWLIESRNAGNSREGFETRRVRLVPRQLRLRCNAGNSREGFETCCHQLQRGKIKIVAMQVIPARGLKP